MKPVIHHNGVSYYESRVNNIQLVEAGARLFENWFADWGGKNPSYLINEFIDNEGIPYCEATEAWLLWSYEPKVTYFWGKPKLDQHHFHIRFHALLLLAGLENEATPSPLTNSKGFPHTSLHVSVEALCRDPWADPDPVAIWADNRSVRLSEALGGATELRLTAPETDLAFQMALRKLDYLCYGYLHPDLEERDPTPHPLLDFRKILKLRSRLSLGYPDPLAALHPVRNPNARK